MTDPDGATPQAADPTTLGAAHVRALVDDITEQVKTYLRDNGATNAAKLVDEAPIAISTRGWLTDLFSVTHPDLVALPRVRLDEVNDARWILGLTADDEPVEIMVAPGGEGRVRLKLFPRGLDGADTLTLFTDAEGARVTFLAGLAMAIHQHGAFRHADQSSTDNQEVTDSER